MRTLLLLATLLLLVALVAAKKKGRCKIENGLECYSLKTLEPGSSYTIESKTCKNGKYPKNEFCSWSFSVDGCMPTVHCDIIDIKGKGKRCGGDKLTLSSMNEEEVFCGKMKNVTFSPETVEYDILTIDFSTNRKRQGKGFSCSVSCGEASPTPTLEPGLSTTPSTQPTSFGTEITLPTTETPTTTSKSNSTPITETPVEISTTSESTSNPITETPSTTAGSPECNCGVANRANRIVGGVLTEVNEYPWQVGLVDPSETQPYCGGSILSSKTILTAAHCTDGKFASSITVVVAEHDWTAEDGQESFSVCGKTEHPAYDSDTVDYDFSILTLCDEIAFKREASPVCLPAQSGSSYDGVTATVSGWGTLSFGGSQPQQLMEVDVSTLTNTACNAAYATYGAGAVTARMICAAQEGKDACQGDSGGPLVTKEQDSYYSLIGVVSWGAGCADPNFPGVYSRVTQVTSFIQDNMSGDTCSPPA